MLRMALLSFVLLIGTLIGPATKSWAQSQKDQVCQGGYGGGCGIAPTRPREPRGPSARDLEVERHNQGIHAYNAGTDAYRRGDFVTALELYQQALAILPRDRDCLAAIPRTRAWMAYKNRDYATALDYYQQALAFLPHNKYLLHMTANTRGMIAGQQAEAAWNRKDIAAALAFYQQAFAYDPDDAWRDNIALARKELQRDQGNKERQQHTQQSLSELTSTARVPAGSGSTTSSLDFKTADTGTADKGSNKGLFGTTSNPANPQLDTSSSAAAVAVQSATDHLTSAATSSAAANDSAISHEMAKSKADCAFGTAACAQATPIAINKFIGQSPGAAQLASHIPSAALKDTEIQQRLAYYERIDGKKLDTQSQLAALQRQIDTSAGDAAALNAQKATLNNYLKQYEADQADTQAKIKERLVAIKVPWNEAPPVAPGVKAIP
jgi:tetratricopeptide (TPR) repeat protein